MWAPWPADTCAHAPLPPTQGHGAGNGSVAQRFANCGPQAWRVKEVEPSSTTALAPGMASQRSRTEQHRSPCAPQHPPAQLHAENRSIQPPQWWAPWPADTCARRNPCTSQHELPTLAWRTYPPRMHLPCTRPSQGQRPLRAQSSLRPRAFFAGEDLWSTPSVEIWRAQRSPSEDPGTQAPYGKP